VDQSQLLRPANTTNKIGINPINVMFDPKNPLLSSDVDARRRMESDCVERNDTNTSPINNPNVTMAFMTDVTKRFGIWYCPFDHNLTKIM